MKEFLRWFFTIALILVLAPVGVWGANTMWSALTELTTGNIATGDMFPCLDVSDTTHGAGGTGKKCAASSVKDFIENQFIATAGSATAGSWFKFATGGTLQTTPDDGSIEMDDNAFYVTHDAGNRGVIVAEHCIRADATRTLPNDTNENAIFNSPANGRITLETGAYRFDALVQVTAMSATSGNALFDWLGAGTATAAAWMWQYCALDSSAPTTATTNQCAIRTTQDTAASAASAGTGTGMNMWAKGTFEITAAGTLIPSIDQVTAAAATVGIGSYFCAHRIGSTSMTNAGQWD